MSRGAGAIRTPDQRLRVFVSSTLRELAVERRVIRGAIERLALAPVMFELGARPHPPRSLYRAYLEQSDIFVGVYAGSYGWVAPGEQVSGLEDEYNLAPDMPMLIYVKRSAKREDRLERLLDRIRDDDRVSYVSYDDPDELAALVTSDLATVLAERFDEAGREHNRSTELPADPAAAEQVKPPSPLTRLIGRGEELRRCIDLLTTQGCRLVTLIGPGGIGKTRLAVAAAREMEGVFADGVVFVDLAPVRDPGLVVSAIAAALGVRDAGDAPVRQRVERALDRRRILLVIDNVEHVMDAVADIGALLDATAVAVLATSRVLLRVEGEQVLPLPPLPAAAAIDMFVERARAVKPDFALTDANASDVAAVVNALDGVPLALELAAARVRVLGPSVLARRLDHALPLLVGGARNHPERQRTLRATIQWSVDLLTVPARELLLRLAVFRTGFTLDAVEWQAAGIEGGEALDHLADLVDSSLVHERDGGWPGSFGMLATVREFAREALDARGDGPLYLQRHADFYADLAVRAEPELVSARQRAWIARLTDEMEDVRQAVEHFLHTGREGRATQVIWPLYWFWWASGRLIDVLDWVARIDDTSSHVDERAARIARFYRLSADLWVRPDATRVHHFEALLPGFVQEGDAFGELLVRTSTALQQLMQVPPRTDDADAHLRRAEEIARERQSPFLIAMTLLMRGRAAMVRGAVPHATRLFEESLVSAQASGDVLSQSAALYQLAWVHLLGSEVREARELLVQVLLIATTVGHEEGIALALEGLFAVSVANADVIRAGRFLGAAEDIRSRRGIEGPTAFSYHQPILEQVESSPQAEAFARARRGGREAEPTVVVEEALA